MRITSFDFSLEFYLYSVDCFWLDWIYKRWQIIIKTISVNLLLWNVSSEMPLGKWKFLTLIIMEASLLKCHLWASSLLIRHIDAHEKAIIFPLFVYVRCFSVIFTDLKTVRSEIPSKVVISRRSDENRVWMLILCSECESPLLWQTSHSLAVCGSLEPLGRRLGHLLNLSIMLMVFSSDLIGNLCNTYSDHAINEGILNRKTMKRFLDIVEERWLQLIRHIPHISDN